MKHRWWLSVSTLNYPIRLSTMWPCDLELYPSSWTKTAHTTLATFWRKITFDDSLFSELQLRTVTNLDVWVSSPGSGSGQRCNDARRATQLKIPRRKTAVKTASDWRPTGNAGTRPDDRPRSRVPRRRGRVDGRGRSRHRGSASDRSFEGGCHGWTGVGRRRCGIDHADDFAIWLAHLPVSTAVIEWQRAIRL